MNKVTFNISGLHCSSCKTLLEAEVGEMPGVKKMIVLFEKGHAGVEYDETKTDLDKIFHKIKELGYTPELLDITATGKKRSKKAWLAAGVFVLVLAGGYFLIETFGGFSLMENLNNKNIGLGLIFLIGLLASFHCVGMCGGFVMAYSCRSIKKENSETPLLLKPRGGDKNYRLHIQYNLGRFISYTVIGGILGGFGSFFGINPDISGTLLLVASVFMVLMGLGLATEIKWLDKIKLKTPEFIAKFIFKNRQNSRPKGPFIIGLATGFMPCGPLQAMQLYALSTGDWIHGALSMAVYALGTIPLLFCFGSIVSLLTTSRLQKLLKISGIIVIVLGLLTFGRAMSSFGLLKPEVENTPPVTVEKPTAQLVKMSVTRSGYQPNVIYIKKGVPVQWIIDGSGATGCTNAIILYNGAETIKKNLSKGETVIEFTPAAGLSEIRFSCWMKMVWGKFIVQ